MQQGICWKQRHNNYTKALQTLRQAVRQREERPLTELEALGITSARKLEMDKTPVYRKKIIPVLRLYPQVNRALLFGSRAKGTHREGWPKNK